MASHKFFSFATSRKPPPDWQGDHQASRDLLNSDVGKTSTATDQTDALHATLLHATETSNHWRSFCKRFTIFSGSVGMQAPAGCSSSKSMADLPRSPHAGHEAQPRISLLELLAQLVPPVFRLRSPLPTSLRITLRQNHEGIHDSTSPALFRSSHHPMSHNFPCQA